MKCIKKTKIYLFSYKIGEITININDLFVWMDIIMAIL